MITRITTVYLLGVDSTLIRVWPLPLLWLNVEYIPGNYLVIILVTILQIIQGII